MYYVSSYIFYILSYFSIFSILFNCYFWVERVKSSDRLEVRASSNASRLFSVHPPWPPVPCQTESNTNLTRLVRNVEYSEYSNRGWQHGSDNTVGLRPVHMSLLGSPGTWLSHADVFSMLFTLSAKVRICHTVSDTT